MEARWMQVELMGHRTIVGLVDEVEMFGAKFGRVRTPGLRKGDACGGCLGKGTVYSWETSPDSPCPDGCINGRIGEDEPEWIGEEIFSPSAIYALSPSTEGEARKAAQRQVGLRRVARSRLGIAVEVAKLPEPSPLVGDADDHPTDDDIPFPPDPVPVSPPAPTPHWTGTMPIGPDGIPF